MSYRIQSTELSTLSQPQLVLEQHTHVIEGLFSLVYQHVFVKGLESGQEQNPLATVRA